MEVPWPTKSERVPVPAPRRAGALARRSGSPCSWPPASSREGGGRFVDPRVRPAPPPVATGRGPGLPGRDRVVGHRLPDELPARRAGRVVPDQPVRPRERGRGRRLRRRRTGRPLFLQPARSERPLPQRRGRALHRRDGEGRRRARGSHLRRGDVRRLRRRRARGPLRHHHPRRERAVPQPRRRDLRGRHGQGRPDPRGALAGRRVLRRRRRRRPRPVRDQHGEVDDGRLRREGKVLRRPGGAHRDDPEPARAQRLLPEQGRRDVRGRDARGGARGVGLGRRRHGLRLRRGRPPGRVRREHVRAQPALPKRRQGALSPT